MTQKRPFNEEVVNEVSSKHPRQDGAGSEIISCNNISIEGVPPNPCELGEASIEKNKTVFQGREISGCPDTVWEAVNDIETDVPRSASILHWATRCASGEDGPSEEIIHLPFFPEYFSYDRPVRSVMSPDDVYHCLLDYPPRKRVPIGPEHQAEIPGCSTHGNVIASFGLENSEPEASDRTFDDIDDSELQGICIISSPAIEPSSYDGKKVGDGRTDCICLDQGSVRCVRQHIIEARDKLRRTLGQGTLIELGFYDMGEVVAEKWSEEEEQLFHEVVYSNPASLGRNFWNALSAVFPFRTKMEIVSYYFNVFMLRKRAEQNRCDPMNVDSDNDEWQGSDDDGGVSEEDEDEDEDSGVESPVVQNGLELHATYEDDEQEGVDGNTSIDEAQEGNEHYDEEGYGRKSLSEQQRKKMDEEDEEGGENNGQDGSCTSSDSGVGVQGGGGGGELKPEGCKAWHEYIVESCNAITAKGGGGGWDGYDDMSCLKSNEDLLPTCTMIEEVFGNGGDLESKTNRW